MKIITIRRYFHIRLVIISLLFLLVCITSFFFQWVYTPLTTDYSGPDFNGDPVAYRWHQICEAFQLDKWINTIMNYPLPLLAIMPSIFSYNFIVEKNGFNNNAYPRIKNYKKFILNSIYTHSLLSGIYFYITFLLFLLIGMFLSAVVFVDNTIYGEITRESRGDAWVIYKDYYTRSFLSDFLGEYFFNRHPIQFYLIYGFVVTFIFGTIYALFSMSISFLTNKKYLSLLIPFGYCLFGSILFMVLINDLNFLAPFLTFTITIYEYPSYYALIPLIIPTIFSITVIYYKLNNGNVLGY